MYCQKKGGDLTRSDDSPDRPDEWHDSISSSFRVVSRVWETSETKGLS